MTASYMSLEKEQDFFCNISVFKKSKTSESAKKIKVNQNPREVKIVTENCKIG